MLSESYDYLSSNFISITSDYCVVFDEINKTEEAYEEYYN